MVIVDCAAEIHLADCEIVIENAVGARRTIDDEKRNHLVERIAEFRVEPAWIHGIDFEASTRVVEGPRLVADPVMALRPITRRDMLDR